MYVYFKTSVLLENGHEKVAKMALNHLELFTFLMYNNRNNKNWRNL